MATNRRGWCDVYDDNGVEKNYLDGGNVGLCLSA